MNVLSISSTGRLTENAIMRKTHNLTVTQMDFPSDENALHPPKPPNLLPFSNITSPPLPANTGSQHVVLLAEDGSRPDLQQVGRLPVFQAQRSRIAVLVLVRRLGILTVGIVDVPKMGRKKH